MELAQKHQDHLKDMKRNVEDWRQYWTDNIKAYNFAKRFVYYDTITDEQRAVINELNQPDISCNLIGAYQDRLFGEFSKVEPSIEVGSEINLQDSAKMVQTIEDHFRHEEYESRKHGTAQEVYRDIASGFSAMKIYTKYKSPMSFDQDVCWGRCYDPTLCGWDILAEESDKSDGSFCFELFPKTKEALKAMYPKINVDEMKFGGNTAGFRWSYTNYKEDIILLCDYYEKKTKKVTIVKLRDGRVFKLDEYNKFLDEWNSLGILEQPPAEVDRRTTDIETIVRYRFIENQVLEYEETEYPGLPIVFMSCKSVMLQRAQGSGVQQITRAYAVNAFGTQKLADVALQAIGNEIENAVQHKIIVAEESLPDSDAAKRAYEDVQVPNVLTYKAFLSKEGATPGEIALPPPAMIQRPPFPQEYLSILQTCWQLIQQELGSFDPSFGKMTNGQLSGIAVMEVATQSNAAAMPMIIGYMRGFNRIAQMYLDMLPKYMVTPRSIPVMGRDGKRSYVQINQPDGVQFKYKQGDLNIKVEAGVNSETQKNRAIQLMAQVGQSFPAFAQFMGSKGLNVIIDNLDMRNIDELKDLAKQFEAEMQQQQAQAQQMQQQQMQNDPRAINAQLSQQKMQLDAQQNQFKNQLAAGQLAIDKERNDTERMKVLSDLKQSNDDVEIAKTEQQTKMAAKQVEIAMAAAELSHKHAKEHHELLLKQDEHRMKEEAHEKHMKEKKEDDKSLSEQEIE